MRYLISIGSVAMATMFLVACHGESAERDATAPQVSGSAVRFPKSGAPDGVTVASVSLEHDAPLTMTGRVVWDEDQTVRVFSTFAGRVVRIAANIGDRVKAGQPLVELDSPDYGSAQADYRKAFAAQSLAKNTLDRSRDLYAHGVISAKELQQAESNGLAADADAERAERVMKQYGDAGDKIDERLVVRSPIAGVVVERSINPGQELRVDQSSPPLFVVTNPNELWLSLDAREDDLAAVKIHEPFSFRVGADGGETFSGAVLRISDYVDPTSRTIKITGKAANPKRRLKGEMFVTAVFDAPSVKQPQVPAAAIYLLGEQHYAFVKDGESFVRRQVAVGAERNGWVPVLAGLKAGEVVVAQGALFLQQILQSQPHG